jgi:hypothetical protein
MALQKEGVGGNVAEVEIWSYLCEGLLVADCLKFSNKLLPDLVWKLIKSLSEPLSSTLISPKGQVAPSD